MRNLILTFLFVKRHFFYTFWGTLGVSRGLTPQKLSTPLKLSPRSWKFARDIIFDHRFYTVTHLGQIISFDPLWGTLGVKKGQKLFISLKVSPPPPPPGAENLCREVISHQRFGTVTHLGQITIFDPFWGTLGVTWESKRVKNCLSRL